MEISAVHWIRATFDPLRQADKEHEAAGSLGYGWLHYGLIRMLRPERVLAIGSRTGFIPACMAQAIQDNAAGRLDFVDAAYTKGEDAEANDGVGWWKTHTFEALDPVITMHLKRSDEFFPGCSDRYGYAYLDGAHEYNALRYDFEETRKRLLPGGIIAIHDTHTRKKHFGNHLLMDEMYRDRSLSVLEFPGTCGLAVAQVCR